MPAWARKSPHRIRREILILLVSPLVLSLLAQISVSLPFTPVPITGQTFGVETLALLLGGWRAFASVTLYILAGAAGLPVFAGFKGGMTWGPTSGYLIGMAVASLVVGTLSDHGATRSLKRAFFSCVIGSSCIFTCGMIGLHHFVPTKNPFLVGMLPFLPGDFIKNFLAASLTVMLARRSR